jgi:hypothetical protein
VRRDIQVPSQPTESPYVMDTRSAVLDARDLRLAVSASVSCLALGLPFCPPTKPN